MMLIGHYCKQQYGQTLQNVSTAFQINFITHISAELFVYDAPAHTVFFLAAKATHESILSLVYYSQDGA